MHLFFGVPPLDSSIKNIKTDYNLHFSIASLAWIPFLALFLIRSFFLFSSVENCFMFCSFRNWWYCGCGWSHHSTLLQIIDWKGGRIISTRLHLSYAHRKVTYQLIPFPPPAHPQWKEVFKNTNYDKNIRRCVLLMLHFTSEKKYMEKKNNFLFTINLTAWLFKMLKKPKKCGKCREK